MKNIRRRKYLNYVEHLLILVSTFTGCVSISAFASLICVPVSSWSSVVGIKFIKKILTICGKKKYTFIKNKELNNISNNYFKMNKNH